ncbi:MAG: hypothetical protein QME64_06600 [bacterium]|nr:hypothetical protein [bacterium]
MTQGGVTLAFFLQSFLQKNVTPAQAGASLPSSFSHPCLRPLVIPAKAGIHTGASTNELISRSYLLPICSVFEPAIVRDSERNRNIALTLAKSIG